MLVWSPSESVPVILTRFSALSSPRPKAVAFPAPVAQEVFKKKPLDLLKVLKAFAIEERDKPKDNYDVIWTISAYEDGPQSVVEEIAKSSILGHGDVGVAVGYLRKNFASIDHSGPAQYAQFEQSGGSEEERTALRRSAHGTMTEFLKHWDERKLPSQE